MHDPFLDVQMQVTSPSGENHDGDAAECYFYYPAFFSFLLH